MAKAVKAKRCYEKTEHENEIEYLVQEGRPPIVRISAFFLGLVFLWSIVLLPLSLFLFWYAILKPKKKRKIVVNKDGVAVGKKLYVMQDIEDVNNSYATRSDESIHYIYLTYGSKEVPIVKDVTAEDMKVFKKELVETMRHFGY